MTETVCAISPGVSTKSTTTRCCTFTRHVRMCHPLEPLEFRRDGVGADSDRGENIFARAAAGGDLDHSSVLVGEPHCDTGNHRVANVLDGAENGARIHLGQRNGGSQQDRNCSRKPRGNRKRSGGSPNKPHRAQHAFINNPNAGKLVAEEKL